MQGTVKRFLSDKGFGFLKPDDGTEDIFFHVSALSRSGITDVLEGDRFTFEIGEGRDGRSAAMNLKLVDG